MINEQAIPLLTPMLPIIEALTPYLERIDKNQYYSNFGPLCQELESRLASRFSEKGQQSLNVVTVSSCTLGLELLLQSLNLPLKSHVLIPALTFVATFTAIIKSGYTPVVCDVDPDNWMLTPELIDNFITPDIKAVIAVATFGQPQDTIKWSQFQYKTGIKVIIDAAAGFGSQWVHTPDIPVAYSMHATKSLAAGEGGFIVTGSAIIANFIKETSNFGINLSGLTDYPVGYLSNIGTNAKLSEYHAAVGLASLDSWEYQCSLRQSVYSVYRSKLDDNCGNKLTWQSGIRPICPTTLSIRLGSTERRNALEKLCATLRIGTRRWYQPLLHQHAPQLGPYINQPLPIAEAISSDSVGIPFSAFLTDAQIQRVVNAIRTVISNT